MRPTEQIAVVGNIDPDAYAASTVVSGWISMKLFEMFLAIILVGEMVSTATLDAKFQQATDSGGTGAKDITGKTITQLTEAGGDDDQQALINLRADEMDVEGGFEFVQLSLTLTTAGADLGATVLGFQPKYAPASDNDAASVVEIVA